MDKTYEDLKEEFEEKVKNLRKECNHPETYWTRECWAIAHTTGKAVKVCEVCRKELEKVPVSEAVEKGYIEEYSVEKGYIEEY